MLAIENVRVEEKGLDLAQGAAAPERGPLQRRRAAAHRGARIRGRGGAPRGQPGPRARAANASRATICAPLINARRGRQRGADHDRAGRQADRRADTISTSTRACKRRLRRSVPSCVAARLNVDGRQVERKIAENRLLPRLDLVGSIGLNGLGGTDAGARPASRARRRALPPTLIGSSPTRRSSAATTARSTCSPTAATTSTASARSSRFPIDNAAAKADYAQAKVNAEAARLSLQQAEENVTLEITQSVNNLKALLKSIDATRIARELAEENVRNQQARYDVGLATTKDLIDFTGPPHPGAARRDRVADHLQHRAGPLSPRRGHAARRRATSLLERTAGGVRAVVGALLMWTEIRLPLPADPQKRLSILSDPTSCSLSFRDCRFSARRSVLSDFFSFRPTRRGCWC